MGNSDLVGAEKLMGSHPISEHRPAERLMVATPSMLAQAGRTRRSFLGGLGLLGLLSLAPLQPSTLWGQARMENGPLGVVMLAQPRRLANQRVLVDYSVRVEGAPLQPGMVLAAWRATRYGQLEGPPHALTGWMVVTAVAPGMVLARQLPAPAPERERLNPPVPVVADEVRLEGSVMGLAPGGAGVELQNLFPQPSAALAPEALKTLTELSKSVGGLEQGLLVVYHPPGAAPDALRLAFDQAQALVQALKSQPNLAESTLYPVVMPLPGQGQALRAELRPLIAQKSGDSSSK